MLEWKEQGEEEWWEVRQGPGHVAHVGCVQDFDFFSRNNVKPLKSLNFKVRREANEPFRFTRDRVDHCRD